MTTTTITEHQHSNNNNNNNTTTEAKNNPKSIRYTHKIIFQTSHTRSQQSIKILHLSPLHNDKINMSKFSFIISALLLLTALFGSTHAFLNDAQRRSSSRSSSMSSLSPLRMTVLTSNGKKIDIPEGTPLKTACEKLGVKPKYSCKR